jgi:hypothetical protein
MSIMRMERTWPSSSTAECNEVSTSLRFVVHRRLATPLSAVFGGLKR